LDIFDDSITKEAKNIVKELVKHPNKIYSLQRAFPNNYDSLIISDTLRYVNYQGDLIKYIELVFGGSLSDVDINEILLKSQEYEYKQKQEYNLKIDIYKFKMLSFDFSRFNHCFTIDFLIKDGKLYIYHISNGFAWWYYEKDIF
jgi:hypothetical protein